MQLVKPLTEADKLPPVLTLDGMLAFLYFALDFARDRHRDDAGKRRHFVDEILASKLVFERSADEYSTVVTPVFWPEQPPQVTAGAGDMTSSVVAIFSGQ